MEVGEVMLVNKSAQKGLTSDTKELVRRVSNESMKSHRSTGSLKSFRSVSSARSDVDRLIDAIQEPTMSAKNLAEADSRSVGRLTRPNSSSSSRPQGAMLRSHSFHSVPLVSSKVPDVPGQANVQDSKTPIKPVRLPAEESAGSAPSDPAPRTPARVLFNLPGESDTWSKPLDASKLDVLVAEDDPINSKIMKKRLEKLGHKVHLTANGEACSSAYGEEPTTFDIVLMDMQVSDVLI